MTLQAVRFRGIEIVAVQASASGGGHPGLPAPTRPPVTRELAPILAGKKTPVRVIPQPGRSVVLDGQSVVEWLRRSFQKTADMLGEHVANMDKALASEPDPSKNHYLKVFGHVTQAPDAWVGERVRQAGALVLDAMLQEARQAGTLKETRLPPGRQQKKQSHRVVTG